MELKQQPVAMSIEKRSLERFIVELVAMPTRLSRFVFNTENKT